MNPAPAGRLGRKLYHSWTSGLMAGECAKLPSFLAGRSRKHWMATESRECSYTHRRTCRQARTRGPERRRGRRGVGPAAARSTPSAAGDRPPEEVTEGSRPWVCEEREGNNHCQVSVVEFLAEIWLIYHWQQKPPSGTVAAVSSLPAIQDNGNICSSKRDIGRKAPGEKVR